MTKSVQSDPFENDQDGMESLFSLRTQRESGDEAPRLFLDARGRVRVWIRR